MRKRAAVMATLVNFVVCVLLLTVLSVSAAKLQNGIIEEELKLTCRLSAEMLDSAASPYTREEYLRGVADEGDMLITYFDVDKSVVYQSFTDDTYLPPSVTSADGTACVFTHKSSGGRIICAGMPLNDGSILCYGKYASSWKAALGDYLWVYVLIVFAALVMQFVIIVRTVGISDKMVSSVMSVLKDFTEGNMDSRMPDVRKGNPQLVAKYNSILSGVQERVFRQQKRNMVFGQMINQMKNGLITVDRELYITFATNMTCKLFGESVEEDINGKSLREVFDNEDFEKAVNAAMENGTGNVITTDIEGKRSDGSMRPLRVYASCLFREGKTAGAMAVVEDITEIRKLEQLRTDFAANVSHEMKTPLTSIKGFVETLQAGAVNNPEMAQKFLNIILVEADRMERLINDILSITKLESGSENVEIKRIPLDRAVMEVCDLLKVHADLKEVTIKASPNPEPVYIMGNPDRVKQLAINLIENGIKYNKTGGSVSVKVMESGDNVYMTVSDTGIGIKSENLGRLFERFYRVDKGRSRAMGGTGLGLAIVKHIVNTMNGTIEVSSKYGEGTEFLITLPKAPAEEIPEDVQMGEIE